MQNYQEKSYKNYQKNKVKVLLITSNKNSLKGLDADKYKNGIIT